MSSTKNSGRMTAQHVGMKYERILSVTPLSNLFFLVGFKNTNINMYTGLMNVMHKCGQ
jgi:hypothetical protein